ncbi:Uncharacterized protein HZ326_9048 [Fusarium oxysporum f. sp. albedinis]|nr:Uncharacterized protein HZ326_9048 [Fusarium oxysporum f. sp. albedinis]
MRQQLHYYADLPGGTPVANVRVETTREELESPHDWWALPIFPHGEPGCGENSSLTRITGIIGHPISGADYTWLAHYSQGYLKWEISSSPLYIQGES